MIRLENVTKRYLMGDNVVKALDGIDININEGEMVAIVGPSGSGKSTLIRCVNYLEQPTDGVISYRGENVLECFKNLPLYRTKVGMVFQQFNLFNK